MPRAPRTCSTRTPVPCGAIAVRDGRCAVHAAEHEAQRGTAADRGYGARHQRARARLLRQRMAAWRRHVAGQDIGADAVLLVCPRCSGWMPPPESGEPLAVADDALHADHFATRPPAEPDRLAHADCNVRAATRQRGPQA